MNFSEKLQVLRKSKGYTQEELSAQLNISRQAVAKWESGQSYPDILNLIQISELMNVTVDYLVKDQDCTVTLPAPKYSDIDKLIEFRIEASLNTYASCANEVPSTRLNSHDFHYERDNYSYHDTYVGSEHFAGQEAIWHKEAAIYAMNYQGRILDERFSSPFLKESLRLASPSMPYRGPSFYQSGHYIYQSKVTGDITWFQGYEEIYYENTKVYECYFHGGLLK